MVWGKETGTGTGIGTGTGTGTNLPENYFGEHFGLFPSIPQFFGMILGNITCALAHAVQRLKNSYLVRYQSVPTRVY